MAADDRKNKILNHLNQSTNGVKYTSPISKRTQTSESLSFETVQPAASPPPVQKMENRKRRVMDHLNQSSEDFNRLADNSEQKKKQQIQNHLKKSLE